MARSKFERRILAEMQLPDQRLLRSVLDEKIAAQVAAHRHFLDLYERDRAEAGRETLRADDPEYVAEGWPGISSEPLPSPARARRHWIRRWKEHGQIEKRLATEAEREAKRLQRERDKLQRAIDRNEKVLSRPAKGPRKRTASRKRSASAEIVEGVDGRGEKIWIVQKVSPTGRHTQERFATRAEAESWLKWS